MSNSGVLANGFAAVPQGCAHGSHAFEPHISAPYEFTEKIIATLNIKHGLDFCCGSGVHTVYLAKHAEFVSGVDISEKALKVAKERIGGYGLNNFKLSQSEALKFLSENNTQYDLIFCSGSLYYFELDEALNLLASRLATGGNFICIETNGDNFLLNFYRNIRNLFVKKRDLRTRRHLLRAVDFSKIQSNFANAQIVYFDFLVLLAPLFSFNQKLKQSFITMARKIDQYLLNKCGLHFLAFKIVVSTR